MALILINGISNLGTCEVYSHENICMLGRHKVNGHHKKPTSGGEDLSDFQKEPGLPE